MRILVTRPPPGGPRTAERLRALGHVVDEVPVIEVAPTGTAWPRQPVAAIVLTSANGLAGRPEPLPEALACVPVHAVGRATAAAAAAAGFRSVTPAGGDAAALAARLRETLPPGAAVLYPTGTVRKPDLEQAMAAAGFAVAVAETYAAVPVAPARLAARLGPPLADAVLHYSRASAAAWVAGVRESGHEAALLGRLHLALSQDVAGPLHDAGARTVRVAARPDEEALLALLPGEG